ncbi:VOC family protein [Vulcanimicrobium alpinum]|uniref:VOC family protein n=1 Tax=Vulcanimicrobium alpinum TaxID=3016050 RepID=UPI0038631230
MESRQRRVVLGVAPFVIGCAPQDEADRFGNHLSDGGKPGACGWLEDKYGVLRQVVPSALPDFARRRRRRESGCGHAGDAGDEETRHRRIAGGLRPGVARSHGSN